VQKVQKETAVTSEMKRKRKDASEGKGKTEIGSDSMKQILRSVFGRVIK